ncbi:MAG: phenylacetate-CoA oxygenase subunit PaaJ [Bacteroidia bacterium]|nr:phenylacetate-CoA oxygenase subunit PaaJ [Bacteroidia bacterium]
MVIDKEQKEKILEFLSEIQDPEIPVISIVELGVIRDIISIDDKVLIHLTPTYSGCPAMDVMEKDVLNKMKANGYENVEIKKVYSPAWTTDWISDDAKEKLRKYGIAPPNKVTADKGFLSGKEDQMVHCPQCNSNSTVMFSPFGSTACKALYKCDECHESFDYFKCI